MITEALKKYFYQVWLDTPLGSMLAISDEDALYLLEFVDYPRLEREVERLMVKTNGVIVPGLSGPLKQIESELQGYFNGSLQEFKVPLRFVGSPFQTLVWKELISLPYGQTRSYTDQARALGKHKAYRAVANANGANKLVIIIPCHRIINSNGYLGGYGGGVHRKKCLIDFEKQKLSSL